MTVLAIDQGTSATKAVVVSAERGVLADVVGLIPGEPAAGARTWRDDDRAQRLVALFFPALWTIVLIRGGQTALGNSLFRSAYEVFYTPLAQEQKRPTKAIVDVGFDRASMSVNFDAIQRQALSDTGTGQ